MRSFSRSLFSWATGAPVLHPFLLAVFPILSLWSSNQSELFFTESQGQVFLPLAVSLLFAGLFWGLLSLVVSDKKKAGLVVVLFLLLFYSYGHVQQTISDFGLLYIKQRFLLVIWLLIFLGGVYLFSKVSASLINLTRSLNVIALVLVIFPLSSIGVYQFTPKPGLAGYENEGELTESIPAANPGSLPDIYYVILDGYASSQVLEETLDFDNSEFLDYLRGQGFYVATQSRSNYPFTSASMASSLNMKHVTYLGEIAGDDRADSDLYYQLMKDSQVMKFLRTRGYKIIHMRKDRMPQRAEELGDIYFGCESQGTLTSLLRREDFADGLVRTTMLNAFRKYIPVSRFDRRQKSLCEFGRFDEINRTEGPKFIYAHLQGPHPPYVFGPQGEPTPTSSHSHEWEPREQYLDQLVFNNGKVMEFVDLLTSTNDPPPVIILQGDHGPFFFGYEHSEKVARTSMGILNAYFLPDGDGGLLYESISPVNTFRLIFNRYFGAGFEFLPDRSYYNRAYGEAGYSFFDVTDEVN